MSNLPAYLTNDVPVMTLSNFWRETRRMKQAEHDGNLSPHLIIPHLKNHKHLGGIIPVRLFTAFLMFCQDQSLPVSTEFITGAQTQARLKTRKGLFTDDKDFVHIVFEDKKSSAFGMLVAASPEAFHTFQTLLDGGKLNSYIEKASKTPFHYPTGSPIVVNSIIKLSMNFNDNTIFMRVSPQQAPDLSGERRLVKMPPLSAEALQDSLRELQSHNAPIQVSNRTFRIATLEQGRPTHANDPTVTLLANCDTYIAMRALPKRPISSMGINFNGTGHIVDNLTTTAPQIRLRVNDLVCTLVA